MRAVAPLLILAGIMAAGCDAHRAAATDPAASAARAREFLRAVAREVSAEGPRAWHRQFS